MPHRPIRRFVLVASVLACGPAAAQVNFDPRALEQLNRPNAPSPAASPPAAAPSKPAQPETPETPAKRPAVETPPRNRRPAPPRERTPERPPARAAPANPSTATPATTPAGPAAKPPSGTAVRLPDSRTAPIPSAPPANPNIPPPIVVPARPPPPATPVVVAPNAVGTVTPIQGGQRITFGPGTADLNPATDQALRTMVHAAPPFNTTTFTVTSYAAGSEEDQSSARRVSLARALAVRSVFITEGVASVRIYVKALGASAPTMADGPPDRVDIVVATAQGAPGGAPAPAPAAPPSPPAAALPPRAR